MPDFLVGRDDLRRTEVRETTPSELAEGEARVRVEKFGLSTNNVTYAVLGDALRYWELFPAPDGLGRVPAWGIAEVVESRAPGIEPGLRVFGLVPMSDAFVARPVPRGGGFEDAAEHRAPLARAYNRYLPAAPDPREDAELVFRPLLGLAVVLVPWIAERRFDDATRVLLTSASSKTAFAVAHLLTGDVDVVGLTSARNRAFVEGLGVYDGVVTYDELQTLDATPTALIDLAGDAGVRARVHEHLGGALRSSTAVGFTHWEAGTSDAPAPPGPAVQFFFAPDEMARRAKEWGADGLRERYVAAWDGLAERLDGGSAFTISRAHGADELRELWLALLDGRADPRRGDVVTL